MTVPTPHRRLLAAVVALLLVFASSGAFAMAGMSGPIKTVVVVVMENRSFDHMLGWMKRLNPAIDGVTGAEWNPANTSDPSEGRVYFGEAAQFVDPDPGHSYPEIRQQIFGSDDATGAPRMNGFVQQAHSVGGIHMTDAVMNGAPNRPPHFMTARVAVALVLALQRAGKRAAIGAVRLVAVSGFVCEAVIEPPHTATGVVQLVIVFSLICNVIDEPSHTAPPNAVSVTPQQPP
ncbi:hypothetical protein TRIUR3_29843 [Triticum urartu]|uniref:Uncharacterized protein n=1 Tax=Triticum urartu TaxID=4572 RepID=M7ZN01_TRIUA|nr:hypothetical protein TRIUR3_29843 [Triticum urartu]